MKTAWRIVTFPWRGLHFTEASEGTNGVEVTETFLAGLYYYKDLRVVFRDGMVTENTVPTLTLRRRTSNI